MAKCTRRVSQDSGSVHDNAKFDILGSAALKSAVIERIRDVAEQDMLHHFSGGIAR
jgi:hypothetical protein